MSANSVDHLLKILKDNSPGPGKPIGQLRADFEKFYLEFRSDQDNKINEFRINNIPSFWIEAPGAAKDQVILFFHGGGFTIGSTRDHADLCGRLSAAAGAKVLSIDYRLAPEHVFPAALEDCVASYNWLLNEGYMPSDIVPTGISAGGNLVLAMLLHLRDSGSSLPSSACCMSPAVDMLFQGNSVTTNAGKDWISRERLDSLCTIYLSETDPKEPLVSPLYGDLRGFPPLMIQVGSRELLLDDNRGFVDRARSEGVDVTFEIWDEMIHCWQIFASVLKEGQEAVESMGGYIRSELNLSQ